MGVVVVGQIGRDLALRAARLPAEGGTGSVGRDAAGAAMMDEAAADGIDVGHVVQRYRTALLITHVDGQARRRLFEDVPE
jgi:ribokinase